MIALPEESQNQDGSGRYRPLRDYALIGNGRTAALVARDGSIDWCCWPYFDSPAVFCRILDVAKGGSFQIAPVGSFGTSRSYLGRTNVLRTIFKTATGVVQLTDLMPVAKEREHLRPPDQLLRLIEGLIGHVEVEVRFHPTFDYARAKTTVEILPRRVLAHAGSQHLILAAPANFRPSSQGATGRLHVRAGDRLWITVTDQPDSEKVQVPESLECDSLLSDTLRYWEAWSARCTYRGPYADAVCRSALVLKLLTFKPTGALIAAPTTSLPEEIGGVRNWDYRFTWLRDSALILSALQGLGYHDEANEFWEWLQSLCIGCCGELQIMYTIHGHPELPEQSLDHLEGYRGSRPVRLGNAAAKQTQLDIYGEVLDAAAVCYYAMRRPFGAGMIQFLQYLADQAAARWREPDYGIWEVRGGPKPFLYSKLLCWVALDRAIRLATDAGVPGNLHHWRRTRDEIREAILTEGYDEALGAFVQAFGERTLDASVLSLPLVGFLPATDPRVQSTLDRIQERLTSNDLVYRYLTDDGLPGGEGAFAFCSFRMVQNFALAGRIDEARTLFERVVSYANDLGLLSEEIDPVRGELLGNYPQGFSHLTLIGAALSIAEAEARGPERQMRTRDEREKRMESSAHRERTCTRHLHISPLRKSPKRS